MHRCHAAPDRWEADGRIRLSARESHHLATVMRIPVGATVAVFDGVGRTAMARVDVAEPDAAVLTLTGDTGAHPAWHGRPAHETRAGCPCHGEGGVAEGARDASEGPVSGPQITLIQALPKGGRMDDIITKGTELGVAAIMPVLTERCVVRVTPDQAVKRRERWERVAVSAAKQCGTPVLPAIAPVQRLSDVAPDLFDACLVATLAPDLVPLHAAVERLMRQGPARVAVVIGPEGDLTAGETARLVAGGAVPVTFGPNTLRTDTAAMYAVAVLTYAFRAAASRPGS